MKKEKVSAIINQISDRHIEEAAVFTLEKDRGTQEDLVSVKTHRKKTRRFKWRHQQKNNPWKFQWRQNGNKAVCKLPGIF